MNLEIVNEIAALKMRTKKHCRIKMVVSNCCADRFDIAVSPGAMMVLMRGTSEKDFITTIDTVATPG